MSVFKSFVDYLKNDGWLVCAVFCLDCHFAVEASKFIAGALQALAAMVKLELPHVNVLTKMDLCADRKEVEQFLVPDARHLLGQLSATTGPKFQRLNQSVAALLDEFSLVSFVPLDISDEESIMEVLSHIDMAVQYGEDADVKMRDFDEEAGGGSDDGQGND